MTQTPNPPAGWYPQGDQERWWDGTAWSDNFRPLGSQPVYASPVYAPPGYGQPTYGRPVAKSHTARNILIVLGVFFLLFVGGCVALVAVVGNEFNKAVNDDTPGGPNNPLTIVEGQAFEVNGFQYAQGWSIGSEPVGQTWSVDNLKVTNERGKADRLAVKISLLSSANNEVLATAYCTAGDGFEKIPEHTTMTVSCTITDPFPVAYDKITIQDAI